MDIYTVEQGFIDKTHSQKPIPLLLTKNKNQEIKEKLTPMKEDIQESYTENGCKYKWRPKNKQRQMLQTSVIVISILYTKAFQPHKAWNQDYLSEKTLRKGGGNQQQDCPSWNSLEANDTNVLPPSNAICRKNIKENHFTISHRENSAFCLVPAITFRKKGKKKSQKNPTTTKQQEEQPAVSVKLSVSQ